MPECAERRGGTADNQERIDNEIGGEKVDRQKIETVSSRLMEVCIENGLTIAEMSEFTFVFPREVRAEIRKIEQRVGFTVESD